MTGKRVNQQLLAVAAAACALPAPVVVAQDRVGFVEEIVVTAMRREERQVSVPAAVTVVSGEALETAGVSKFQDLGNVAPGVQISRSGSYTQASIRGVTTTFAGSGQETNVGLYIDGFYQSDQLSINQDFANLENIQILKGPQSVLYGRNATGGAILITTLSPDMSQAQGNVSLSYARYDDIIGKAYWSVPIISDKLAFNVAGYWRENDGYFEDALGFSPNAVLQSGVSHTGGRKTTPFRNRAVRTKLKFTPSDAVALTLGYNYTFIDDPRSFGYQMIDTPTYQRDKTRINYRPLNESEGDEFTLVAEFDLGPAGRLVSRTGYVDKTDDQRYDFDGTPNESFTGTQLNKRRTLTQSVDYSFTPTESLSLLAGAFYYRDRFKVERGYSYYLGFNLAGDPTLGRVTDTTYSPFDTDSWSVYLDATWQFAPRWYLTVGARYNYDEKDLERHDFFTFDPGFAPPLLMTPDTSGNGPFLIGGNKDSWSSTTPHAILRFEIDPNTNVYASYSRGFKSGTINTAAPFNILKPETVDAYEVGYKLQRGGFRFESSAYYYDYKNNQVSALSATTPGLTTLIQNASDGSEIYGAELQVNWRPLDSLALYAGVAYTHARYRSFTNATNVTFSGGRNQSVIGDWTNRRIARAPDWSGNVGADYSIHFSGGTFVLSTNVAFSSRYAPQNSSYQCEVIRIGAAGYCDPAGPNGSAAPGKFEENGWAVANAQISWAAPGDRLALALFVENLTDERYKIISAGSAYGSYEMYNQPRSFGGRVSYRF